MHKVVLFIPLIISTVSSHKDLFPAIITSVEKLIMRGLRLNKKSSTACGSSPVFCHCLTKAYIDRKIVSVDDPRSLGIKLNLCDGASCFFPTLTLTNPWCISSSSIVPVDRLNDVLLTQ